MRIKRDDLLMKKLDELASKVDDVRVKDLPQMKLDMQSAIADIKLHVEKTVNPIRLDVGGLKTKAAVAGGIAGIVGTGLVSFLFQMFGHK